MTVVIFANPNLENAALFVHRLILALLISLSIFLCCDKFNVELENPARLTFGKLELINKQRQVFGPSPSKK